MDNPDLPHPAPEAPSRPHFPALGPLLAAWAGDDETRAPLAATVLALAAACQRIASLAAEGPLAGELGRATGVKSGCDDQKALDVLANEELIAALRTAPVAAFASEEMAAPLLLKAGAPLLVAADPIDGSSNIDANISIGTIFSVLPAGELGDEEAFLQPGTRQLAAGFAVYGPFTSLVLTLGEGTDIFTLDRASGVFRRTLAGACIPGRAAEYAINASNARHWDSCIRRYIDGCVKGEEGPRGKDYNMRWTASPVADIFRILRRGGIFLYPGDARQTYAQGRLRLVYEASPLAFLIEQAGGAASSGVWRILDMVPEALHQHVPFIAGSREEVEAAAKLCRDPESGRDQLPLFGRRGLFRF